MKKIYISLLLMSFAACAMQEARILTLNTGLLRLGLTENTPYIGAALKKLDRSGRWGSKLARMFGGDVGDLRGQGNMARADRLADTMLKYRSKFDVICLQEAFDPFAVGLINKKIKEYYPYSYIDARRGGWGIGTHSGLAIFSKFPIKDRVIEDFTCWKGEEAFARKGVMGVRLDVNGCPLFVFSTHLQAGGQSHVRQLEERTAIDCTTDVDTSILDRIFGDYDPNQPPKTKHIANIELQQARRVMERFTASAPDAPRILVGDFNINSNNQANEYEGIKAVFEGVVDTHDDSLGGPQGTAWKEDGTPKDYRIDYIFLLNPESGATGKSSVLDYFNLKMTDHLGVLGTITMPCGDK